MSLTDKHPSYNVVSPMWKICRDVYRGALHIKGLGVEYLPPTGGMRLDGMQPKQEGYEAYNAYKDRAEFPEDFKQGVATLMGMLHRKPATIDLPAALEPLREKATLGGESLDMLLERINEEQLVVGRLGLIADLPVAPDPTNPLPYIAMYEAESIENWDDGSFVDGFNSLNLVVLNESGFVRTDQFTWEMKRKYRVLQLGNLLENEADGTATYSQGVFIEQDYDAGLMSEPKLRGVTLKQIPFVFINTKDILATPDNPPLLPLASKVLTIYRGEADYRQNLHMQGQDTLVVIGAKSGSTIEGQMEPLRVGAGSRIEVEQGGDAKYIGVTSSGLSEQRQAIENDKSEAKHLAGQLVQTKGTSQNVESGEALKTRLAAQTATLVQIAKSGSAGLEYVLKIIAQWLGANPDEVKVTPNLEFGVMPANAQAVLQLLTGKTMGLPLSLDSLHAYMVKQGITELDFQTELDRIEEEKPILPPIGTDAGGDPNSNNNGNLDTD